MLHQPGYIYFEWESWKAVYGSIILGIQAVKSDLTSSLYPPHDVLPSDGVAVSDCGVFREICSETIFIKSDPRLEKALICVMSRAQRGTVSDVTRLSKGSGGARSHIL